VLTGTSVDRQAVNGGDARTRLSAPQRCDGSLVGGAVRSGGTGSFGEALKSCPAKEDAMCYSRDWQADAERQRQEAKARQAHEKRAGVIHDLRADAEKRAEKARTNTQETVPAK